MKVARWAGEKNSATGIADQCQPGPVGAEGSYAGGTDLTITVPSSTRTS